MKAALVSATSLAALLAFEVGLDVAIDAQPARAQATFSVSSPTLKFGYVLLNTTATASSVLTDTITNLLNGSNTVTVPAVSSYPFSVVGGNVPLASLHATSPYQFTILPTITGTPSAVVTLTANHTSASMVAVTLTGTAVAPVQSIVANTLYARLGAGAQTIAALTVSNIGDADLNPAFRTMSAAQLLGTIGGTAGGSVFTGSGGSVSLQDTNYGTSATTTATFNYVYTPTSRSTVSATVTASFSNGNSAGTNHAQTTVVTLVGQGVGPAFASTIGNASYSNSTAASGTTTTVGTIKMGTNKAGNTAVVAITLANASTDGGGTLNNSTLTDLTLENFALSGADASDFTLVGFTDNQTLAEAGTVDLTLDFTGPTVGNYTADLSFTTDEGAAYGATGAVFTYVLSANIPEPATVVTFGMGLAGLGWVRRRRAARRSAAGANLSAA